MNNVNSLYEMVPYNRQSFYMEDLDPNLDREINTTLNPFVYESLRNRQVPQIQTVDNPNYISSYVTNISNLTDHGYLRFSVFRCNLPVEVKIHASFADGARIMINKITTFGGIIRYFFI